MIPTFVPHTIQITILRMRIFRNSRRVIGNTILSITIQTITLITERSRISMMLKMSITVREITTVL